MHSQEFVANGSEFSALIEMHESLRLQRERAYQLKLSIEKCKYIAVLMLNARRQVDKEDLSISTINILKEVQSKYQSINFIPSFVKCVEEWMNKMTDSIKTRAKEKFLE